MTIQPHAFDDPLDLVRTALERLPVNPMDASDDDLKVIMAVEEGLARQTLATFAAHEKLASAVLRDEIALPAAVDEQHRLEDTFASLRAADARLTDYTRAAFAARGIDIDALADRPALPDPKDDA